MSTLLSPTPRRLDRLDEQAYSLRVLLLEMAVAVSVPTPDLRNRAREVCVNVGLLISPGCNLLRDVDYVIAEAAKWQLHAGDGEARDGNHTRSPDIDMVGVPPCHGTLASVPAWRRSGSASCHSLGLQRGNLMRFPES